MTLGYLKRKAEEFKKEHATDSTPTNFIIDDFLSFLGQEAKKEKKPRGKKYPNMLNSGLVKLQKKFKFNMEDLCLIHACQLSSETSEFIGKVSESENCSLCRYYNMDTDEITRFLDESNSIESVFDKDSLHQAVFAWNFLNEQKELTIQNILKTHKILMLHQNIQPNEKGYFRKCEVMIGGRWGKPWTQVSGLMEAWVRKTNLAKTERQIRQDHVDFETIHPFVDGNGRLGRMLLNWQRVKNDLPILILWSDEKYENYYPWFKE